MIRVTDGRNHIMKPATDAGKVSVSEKIGFVAANIGNLPLMSLLSSFFLIFYTDVVGLDPSRIATLFLISKIMDGISDPLMGFFLDRFPNTKMGKFRPMLILGTIICVINYILVWFGALWIPVGKYVVVYITYLLLGWTFDVMDIALNSILPVMSEDVKERNTLSLLKVIGFAAGSMVLSIIGPLLVANGTLKEYYILIFGSMLITLVFSVGGALLIKERVAFKGDEEEKYSFRDLLGFFRLPPVSSLFLTSLVFGIGTYLTGANTFFYTYVMGDLKLMSSVTMFQYMGMMPMMLLSPIIANKIGKKKACSIGLTLAGCGFLIRLLSPTSYILACIGTLLFGIGSGTFAPMAYGLQADNTSYVEYHTGKHAEAAIASLNSFITKVAQGIAGALPGYILSYSGYVPNSAVQTPSALRGLISSAVTLPGILLLLGALVFTFGYRLTEEEVSQISEELRIKHARISDQQ